MDNENVLLMLEVLVDIIHSQQKKLDTCPDVTQLVLEKAELAERFAATNKVSEDRARRLVDATNRIADLENNTNELLDDAEELIEERENLIRYACFLERFQYTAGVDPNVIKDGREKYHLSCGKGWEDNEFIFQSVR